MLRAVAVVVTIIAVSARQSRPVATLLGLELDSKYLLLCLVATLWGIARSGGNVVDSSFADSIPTGATARHQPVDEVRSVTCLPVGKQSTMLTQY